MRKCFDIINIGRLIFFSVLVIPISVKGQTDLLLENGNSLKLNDIANSNIQGLINLDQGILSINSNSILQLLANDQVGLQVDQQGKVSIGTDLTIDNIHTVIQGPVFIGNPVVGESEKIEIKESYVNGEDFNFQLWVRGGMMSDDYAITDISNWPDFVFNEEYELKSLDDLKDYINRHNHLPHFPSEMEVLDKGFYSQHDFNMQILQTIEELTLHIIEESKRSKKLKSEWQEHLYRTDSSYRRNNN